MSYQRLAMLGSAIYRLAATNVCPNANWLSAQSVLAQKHC